jgi:hypothetical protein
MEKFRDLLQWDLNIVYMNRILGDKNRKMVEYLAELQVLRGIVPICSNCKSIRDAQDNWHPIEKYLPQGDGTRFSHGICPKCESRYFPDFTKEA